MTDVTFGVFVCNETDDLNAAMVDLILIFRCRCDGVEATLWLVSGVPSVRMVRKANKAVGGASTGLPVVHSVL